jgi:hypothetical protein
VLRAIEGRRRFRRVGFSESFVSEATDIARQRTCMRPLRFGA